MDTIPFVSLCTGLPPDLDTLMRDGLPYLDRPVWSIEFDARSY